MKTQIKASVFILLFHLFCVNFNTHAATQCIVPTDLEKPVSDQFRLACLKNSYFLQEPRFNVSVAQALQGPELDEVTFNSQETVHCRYFYRYQNGASNKFRCYRTNNLNQLMNDKGEVVPEAVSVGQHNTELEDILLSATGQVILSAKGKPLKADVLKVRFQDGSKRHRENFASAASTRISWILGIPTEHYYSVAQVKCFGCEKNPWNEGKNPQKEYKPNMVNSFFYASIERKNEAKRVIKAYVDPQNKFTITPWKWSEFVDNFKILSEPQKLELQVLALYAQFFQVVENRGSQHVLLCEKQYYNKETRECVKSMPAIHDIGAAFGNRDTQWVDKETKNHPRADFKAYQAAVMLKPSCELPSVPGGLTRVNEAARLEFVKRLSLLNYDVVKAILENSYFQYADLIFYKEVSQKTGLSGEALNQKVLDLWTQVIMKKVADFSRMTCLP